MKSKIGKWIEFDKQMPEVGIPVLTAIYYWRPDESKCNSLGIGWIMSIEEDGTVNFRFHCYGDPLSIEPAHKNCDAQGYEVDYWMPLPAYPSERPQGKRDAIGELVDFYFFPKGPK